MSAIENLHDLVKRFKWRISRARAYREIYETPAGQAVIHDLLRESGILEVAHTPGDPHHTDFRDGRSSMGKYILEQLRWSEPELVKLAEEQTAERLNPQEES